MKNVFLLAGLFSVIAFAAVDPVQIQDQINILQAQHALIVHERTLRPAQDAAQDAAYNKQLAALQAQLPSSK